MHDIKSYEKGSEMFEAYRINFDRIERLIRAQTALLSQYRETVTGQIKNAKVPIDEALAVIHRRETGVNLDAIATIKREVATVVSVTMESIHELGNVGFLMGWLHVMLITFAEAYIQDMVQALLARGLDSATLSPDLKSGITKNLTRQITRESPHEWIKSLKRLGIEGRDDAFMAQLTKIWNQRHTIVHGPNSEPAKMSPDHFKATYQRVNDFLIHIDKQFAALLRPTAPAE